MSNSNRDLIGRLYTEFNETLELPRWALDDGVVWHPPADEPDNGVRMGAETVMRYVHDWARSFDEYRCELQELVESDDCIAAVVVLHGQIGGSSAELTLPLTQVWRIRDDKVVEVREYRTKTEALQALAGRPGT
jgi:ketosteroid isomerase-like protein